MSQAPNNRASRRDRVLNASSISPVYNGAMRGSVHRQHSTRFGRRPASAAAPAARPPSHHSPGSPGAPAPHYRYRSEEVAAAAAKAQAEAEARRFVARFNWWLAWVGVGILATGISFLKDLTGSSGDTGLRVVPLTPYDDELFLVSSVLMVLIGAFWTVKGLFGREALVIGDDGVRGMTLYGTKHIRWQDVSHIRVTKHDVYGAEIQIHATRGTPSSSWILNCIPLYVGLTDRTAEDVLSAVRMHRPDL